MDIVNQSFIFLSGLFVINGCVIVLLGFEYRKNKQAQLRNQALVDSNKLLAEKTAESLELQKAFLGQVVASTSGLANAEQAKETADKMIAAAAAQAKQIGVQVRNEESTFENKLANEEEKTSQKAAEILSEAINQAKDIIKETTNLKADVNEKMQSLFDQTLKESKALIEEKNTEFINRYNQSMGQISDQYIDILQKANKDIEDDFIHKSQSYLNEMKDRLMELSGQKREVMEKEMNKIQQELQLYKSQQMNQIESNIYEILARAAESVIGQAVNFDLHQELIIKALEQAKREALFL